MSDAVAMDALSEQERVAVDDVPGAAAEQQLLQRKRGRPRLIDESKDKLIQSVMQQRGTTNARMIQDELARAHSVKLTYEVIRRRVKELSLQSSGGGDANVCGEHPGSDSEEDEAVEGESTITTPIAADESETQKTANEITAALDKAVESSSEHQQIARDLDLLAETVRTIVSSAHSDQGAESELSDESARLSLDGTHSSDSDEEKIPGSAVPATDEPQLSADLEPEQTSFIATTAAARGQHGEYSLEVCQLVVAKYAEGKTHKQIAAELQMPATSVQTIIKKAKRKGAVLPAQRAGRPRATSGTLEQTILELVRSKPAMSARAVQAHLSANNQLDVSFETIRRRVRDCRKVLRTDGDLGGLKAPGLVGEEDFSSDSDKEKGDAAQVSITVESTTVLLPTSVSLLEQGAQQSPPAKRRKYGEYSNELREACVHKHENEGLTYATISGQLNIPHDTVRAIVRKAKKTGTVQTAPRSGRPRKTSDIVDKVIIQAVKANQRCTAKMIQEDLWTVFNVKVSCETVRRRVKANTKQRLLASPPSSPVPAPVSGALQPMASTFLMPQVLSSSGFTSAATLVPLTPLPLLPMHQTDSNTGILAPLPIPINQLQAPPGSHGAMQSILNFQAHQAPSEIVTTKSTTAAATTSSKNPTPTSTNSSNSTESTTADDKSRKKRNDYSVEVREQCVSLHAQGYGYRRIGQELKMPHTTVRAIVEKVQRTGSVLPAARSGRPRKTDEIVDKVILQAVKNNEKSSARTIQEELQNAYGVKVSCETIRRRVKDHSRLRYTTNTSNTSALLLTGSTEPSQESQGFGFEVPQVQHTLQPAALPRSSFQAQLQEVNQFSDFTTVL